MKLRVHEKQTNDSEGLPSTRVRVHLQFRRSLDSPHIHVHPCLDTHTFTHNSTHTQTDARFLPMRDPVLWFTTGGREGAFIVLL